MGAGGTGLLAAVGAGALRAPAVSAASRPAPAGDGTPEQVHLTWGNDPATSVVVSWASPGRAVRPRVLVERGGGREVVAGHARSYTDGLNGETVWTYHAVVEGLRPDTGYSYVVTADNLRNGATPVAGSVRTAPAGRVPFRFTSFGDLATPNTQWVLSYGQSAYAVKAVESFQPLFHLLNGDLCYADLNPAVQPEVWRDFGNNNQASAAFRPWMPCPGNHEIEFDNGPQGFTSYLTRYLLPDNGVPRFRGHWYSFRVGSAVFVSLDADDVVYQDAGPLVSGPAPLMPAAGTGNPAIAPGTSFYIRGYSGGAQTAWLRRTLAAARADRSVDWIIVQMHQDAASSSATGNGSDLGIREEWLPLFDAYQVDLVLCGHDHDYERSFPVRGYDSMAGHEAATGAPVQTRRPHPVTTTAADRFDTSTGTVHLILGGGGTSAPLDDYGVDSADGLRQAKVFTRANRPVPGTTGGTFTRPAADAVEDATWSAMRDPATGYGVAVFDLDPGEPGGETSITVTYYHAAGADPANPNTGTAGAPNPDYTPFETFTLARPRSDGHGHHSLNQGHRNRQSRWVSPACPGRAQGCPRGGLRPIGSEPEMQAHRWVTGQRG